MFFEGTEAQLEVFFIQGQIQGPTLLVVGGIQGDEPGGYLAADLYADISLKTGNMIVVPRANFLSIVRNARGLHGDMNRKFALSDRAKDRETRLVEVIKSLMRRSDCFLNLHDGSGFYSPTWESDRRNPLRYGQSIIADAEEFKRPDETIIRMGSMVQRVLDRVNPQIPEQAHRFRFNNHRTLMADSLHKEQRLSATFHAMTQVGIPAFGIETSKDIGDYRLRVRYQTMVINAFLEELGIIPETPKIYLDNPQLDFLVVSINGRTPIVVQPSGTIRVERGDRIKILHIASNYRRGLTARIKVQEDRFNDLNQEVPVFHDTLIEVKKDRFLMARVPVEIIQRRSRSDAGKALDPKIRYFCVRVNDSVSVVEPGGNLKVVRGDVLTLLDPRTNLQAEDEAGLRIDLRGFQAEGALAGRDDRGHRIDTSRDLQEQYAKPLGSSLAFALQAKWNNRVIAESTILVVEPRLQYMVFRESGGLSFVAYPGDRLEVPHASILQIVDLKTNTAGAQPLKLAMGENTVAWTESCSAGIEASRLPERDLPLDVTLHGRSIGRIWLRQGSSLRVTSGNFGVGAHVVPARY